MSPRKTPIFWIVALFGWLLALVLLVQKFPRIISKLTTQQSYSRALDWPDILQRKINDISVEIWADSRPLLIFVGDSHVEFGDWYHLFRGGFSVRNCGLSMARIDDVCSIVTSIPDQKTQVLVLMCGINDIASGESANDCLERYGRLIRVSRQRGIFQSVVAVSVFPLRSSLIDLKSQAINQEVAEFNERLKLVCSEQHVKFIDVTPVLATKGGALASDFTQDGLHLNASGYKVLADFLRIELGRTGQATAP